MNRSPYNSTSNRSPSNSLPLRKASIGFLNFKTAAGLSQRSVDSYQRILEQWADYAGDKKVSQFTFSKVSSKHLDFPLCLFYLGTHRIQDGKPHEARALFPVIESFYSEIVD